MTGRWPLVSSLGSSRLSLKRDVGRGRTAAETSGRCVFIERDPFALRQDPYVFGDCRLKSSRPDLVLHRATLPALGVVLAQCPSDSWSLLSNLGGNR